MQKRMLLILCMFITRLHAQTTLTSFIDSLLATEIKANEPGGVVLVSKEGRIIYQKAFGMAQLELQVPTKENIVFHIGSLTKQFTAVAILQLYEQGKLSLQDTLGKFITGCSPEVGAITIEQLLTHTSGLAEKASPGSRNETPGDMVASYINQPLQCKTGTKWQYTNTNYILLGYIIEKVTGSTYGNYLTAHIFKPAGMQHSCLADNTKLVMNRAAGYKIEKNGNILNDRIANHRVHYAAGGILSTAQDMFAWYRSLYAGKLIKKETMAKAFAPGHLSDGTVIPYGYGWHLEKIQDSPTLRHGGSVPGFIAEAVYLPREDVYVVILTNAQSPRHTVAIGRVIAAMTIGKPYPFTATTIDPKLLPRLQGVYENSHNETVVITANGNKLHFQRPGGKLYEIKPASEYQFFFDEGYVVVEFHADASHTITGLTFTRVGIGPAIEWKKTSKPVPAN
jgi:CubicO group peptidase (beta-lactamase class C family)